MKRNLYKKAWKVLEDSTPMDTDCGVICSRACCKGSSNEGMLLFPGEEQMFPQTADWFVITDSNILLPDGTPVRLFTCKGECNRGMRPLSCRIFPVIPHIDGSDCLEFVPDLRGAAICPLLNRSDIQGISPDFIDTLYTAFSSIIDDEKVLDFIEIISNQHDELVEDFKKFYG